MLRPWSSVAWALAGLAVAAAFATCAPPPGSSGPADASGYSAEDTASLLVGTWLREYAGDGVQVRRLLVLEAGGAFREASRVTDASGQVRDYLHEGTWLFDGTNLKRKYTSINGEPPSRLNLPFATFAIVFETRNEFVGVDHIHDNRIRYRRVAPETEL